MRRLLLAALVCAAVSVPLVARAQSRGKSFSRGSSFGRSPGPGHRGAHSGVHRQHSGFGHHNFHRHGFHRPRSSFGFGHHGFHRPRFSFGFRHHGFHSGFGRHHGGFLFHHRKRRFHRHGFGYPVYSPYSVLYYSAPYYRTYNGSYVNRRDRYREPVRYNGHDDVEYDNSRYGEHYFDSREDRHRERRGPDGDDAPEESTEEAGPAAQPSATARSRGAEEPSAVLVLRDGRRLEMANYAITDQAVYHLAPGVRARRIRLTEIDLPATRRLNQELGLDFRLPWEKQGNLGPGFGIQ